MLLRFNVNLQQQMTLNLNCYPLRLSLIKLIGENESHLKL